MMINNTFADPVIYVLPRKIYLCMIVHRVSRKLDILKIDYVVSSKAPSSVEEVKFYVQYINF